MIVTGIFDLEKYEKRGRSTLSYIESAGWLLGSTVPLVVFCDILYLRQIRAMRPETAITIWQDAGPEPTEVPTEEGIARSRYRWNPMKDTPRYLGIMRRKISWLRRGAELAKEPVTWADLALPGRPLDSPWVLLEGAAKKIKIAEISHVPLSVRSDRALYYADHYWPLGGGVIRGSPEDLAWLDDRVEEEWRWCLDNAYAATDEMMLGFVRFRHPERFETYYADHPTLVDNWWKVRASRELIVRMALRALDEGLNDEARRRLDAVSASLT